MHRSPRPASPKLQLSPLDPPSWTRTPLQSHYPEPTDDDSSDDTQTRTLTRLPGLFRKPFNDPYEALCRVFNVAKADVLLRPDGTVPPTITVPVLRDAHMPTHTLVALDSHPSATRSSNPFAPSLLALPINADLFAERFAKDIRQLSTDLSVPGSTLPVPYWDHRSQRQVVTLPTIPLHVPHPPSLPLLLLYGLGLHLIAEPIQPRGRSGPGLGARAHAWQGGRPGSSSPRMPAAAPATMSTLAAYLLPPRAIEEFPAVPAIMADAMARWCTDLEMRFYTGFNQGLWANVLALAPMDAVLVGLVRTAWNVTKEARRIRTRLGLHPDSGAAVAGVEVPAVCVSAAEADGDGDIGAVFGT